MINKSWVVVMGLFLSVPALANPLFDFGKQSCQRVLAGEFSQYDAASYKQNLSEANMSEAEFCNCTGERFVNNAPYQQKDIAKAKSAAEEAAVMENILWTNMMGCMPAEGEG